jgi:two-component system sensor histidine kinase RegB
MASGWVSGLLVWDTLQLTALLYFSGGPFNPFSIQYLVQVALAVVIQPPRWAWLLGTLSVACMGGLFIEHIWLDPEMRSSDNPHLAHMRMHLYGMWLALGVASAFILYFVSKVRVALAEREAQLAAAQARAQRGERLASLATLAAGAAHELATPLSTIALVAKELQRDLQGQVEAPQMADLELMQKELARCRAILQRMSVEAGQAPGEAPAAVSVAQLLAEAMDGLTGAVIVPTAAELQGLAVQMPLQAAAQAVRALLQNALQVSPADVPVQVSVVAAAEPGQLAIVIRDRGPGMSAEVVQRAGEPFFTTKAPGQGMGLGLFLAREVLERSGGSLRLQSSATDGTTAQALMPAAHLPTAARGFHD